MILESFVSLLERLVLPGVLLFGLMFLVMSALLVRRRLKFGTDSLGTTRLFLDALARRRFEEAWRALSPELRESLSDEQRAAVRRAGVSGVAYLAHFLDQHASVFPVGRFKMLSLHKVPLGEQHRELVMIRAQAEGVSRGVIVWLSRSTLSASLWAVEDVYLQPQKGERTPPQQLTLSGRRPAKRSGSKLLSPGAHAVKGERAQKEAGAQAEEASQIEEGSQEEGSQAEESTQAEGSSQEVVPHFEAPVVTPTPRGDTSTHVVRLKG